MTRALEIGQQLSSPRVRGFSGQNRIVSQTMFDNFSELMAQISEQFNSIRKEAETPQEYADSRPEDAPLAEPEIVNSAALAVKTAWRNPEREPSRDSSAIARSDHDQPEQDSILDSDVDAPIIEEFSSSEKEARVELTSIKEIQADSISEGAAVELPVQEEIPFADEIQFKEQAETTLPGASEILEEQVLVPPPQDEAPASMPLPRANAPFARSQMAADDTHITSNHPAVQNVTPIDQSIAPQEEPISQRAPKELDGSLSQALSIDADGATSEPHLLSSHARGLQPLSNLMNSAFAVRGQLIDTATLASAPKNSQYGLSAHTENAPQALESLAAARPETDSSLVRETSSLRTQESSRASEASRAQRPVLRSALLQNIEKVEGALKDLSRAQDGKSISVKFDPPELGTVKVDVQMRDGALHARLTAESPQVTQLLRERALELQSLLRRLGLDVDRVTVSVGPDGDSRSWEGAFLNGGQGGSTDQGNSQSERRTTPQWLEAQRDSSMIQKEVLDHWIA